MSERFYRWLLQLYPLSFQNAYGREALLLFRDRLRVERSFGARAQLWLDMLLDLAKTVPQQHLLVARSRLVPASTHNDGSGAPNFTLIETRKPSPAALILGSVLAFGFIGFAVVLLTHGGHPLQTGSPRGRSAGAVSATWLGKGQGRAVVNGASPTAAVLVHSGDAQRNPTDPQSPSSAKDAEAEDGTLVTNLPPNLQTLSPADRARVIAGVITNLKQFYLDPRLAQKMADVLLAHANRGDYNAQTDSRAFAALLTAQMQAVSDDRHLVLFYSPSRTQEQPAPVNLERYRAEMQRTHCSIETLTTLPRNIGYIKLNEFPDPSVCRDTVVSAMESLHPSSAVIFDLRDNHGGNPEMVALISGYLFTSPTHLIDIRNRAENTTRESWTAPARVGRSLAGKPAYILTSHSTFSGAEEFAYALQSLRRATVVGEPTGGGAHMVSPHRIDEHFTIGVPDAEPISPVTHRNWEGTGVVPEVITPASDALRTAEALAVHRRE